MKYRLTETIFSAFETVEAGTIVEIRPAESGTLDYVDVATRDCLILQVSKKKLEPIKEDSE
jgi:hypothetical protein